MADAPANAAAQSLTPLRRAFVDICRGYSVAHYDGQPLYVRHLSHVDHLGYDDLQARYEEDALLDGALREVTRLAQLRAQGLWSDAREAEIARQKDTIARFEDTIKNTPQPSVAASLASQLAGEKKRLNEMLSEKAALLGMTAEVYAQRRLNDHYVVTNLFADPQMTQPVWSAAVFDNLEEQTVDGILAAYHEAIEPCSDPYLRRLAVQDLFTSHFSQAADDLSTFYGRPLCWMTYYQIRLGAIGRYFRSLLGQLDVNRLPEEARTDPDAIERHFTAKRKMEEMAAEGKVPTNLTSGDMESMGMKGQMTKLPAKEMNALEMVRHLQSQQRGGAR